MPNVQTVSFGPGASNADLQAQQVELQRRQQYADLLRQQAMAPIEQQQVSGRVVPISPIQGFAKLAQALLANSAQKGNEERQTAIGNESAKRSADMLRSLMQPQGGASPAPEDIQLSSTPQQSTPGMQQPAGGQLNPDQQRAIAAYQIDPELGRALMTNMFNQTNEQKNNAAEGVDPRLAGALRTAKMRKEGIIEYQPGTTSQDLATGAQRFQPKMGEGIMPTGDGGAQAIPGYGQAASGIAGQTAQAQAAAQAGFQMKEITGPDGVPRMVTAQQAAQMAQGGGQPAPQGPPNQGFPPGAQVPAPMPGAQQGRLDILTQERQAIMQRPDSDPRKAGDLAAITREIQGAGGGQQQAQPGIPMQSEAQRAAQVGAVENGLAIDKNLRLNAQSPEAQQKIIDAQSVLSLAKEAMPLLDVATGSGAGALRDYLYSKVGKDTDASQAAAQLAAIGGQMVSKMPKMSGPQSDKDVQLYKEMAGRIGDPEVTSGNKKAALETIQRLNEKYLSQNQGSMPAAAAAAVQGGGGLSPAEANELAQLRARLGRK